MKTGILTFHRSFNYGAFLQCWSLCTKLQREFPDVEFEIVDYTSPRVRAGYEREISIIKTEAGKQAIRDRNAVFTACQQKLPLSSPELVTDDLSEIAAYLNERYDAVIVGSDAVWNWNTRGFPNIYFLKDFHGKKFSFAASAHGMSFQDAEQEQRDYLTQAFSEFDYLGVRDCNTENMVKSVLPDAAVYHNCDPTVLLELDRVPCDMDALREKMERRGVDFSKPLIGMMAGDTIGAAIKRHYGNKVQIVSVYTANPYADVFLNDLTPFEWARVFSFFKVTLTHFFHGTLLSLKNGTPVIPVESVNSFSSRNVTKIEDLLTRLDLLAWREVVNHENYDILHRAAEKLLHRSDAAVWKRVIARIDEFLSSDLRQDIWNRLDKEAQAYQTFADAFAQKINDKEGE